MRRTHTLAALLILTALAAALTGCGNPAPPQGRWEAGYDMGGTIVAARVAIGADGLVRVSAPDLLDVADDGADARAAAHARVAQELAERWSEAAPQHFDFDGRAFTRPGGVAHQMEWDDDARRMTLVVYLGARAPVRILLRAVDAFSDDPFARGP